MVTNIKKYFRMSNFRDRGGGTIKEVDCKIIDFDNYFLKQERVEGV